MLVAFGAAGLGALAACAGTAPVPAPLAGEGLRVTDAGAPLGYADGARARVLADARCGGRVRTSIRDRFDDAAGAWVFVEGCT